MEPRKTITPRQAIARVQELAQANFGPIGAVNFEFVPLAEGVDVAPNWNLTFRAAPANRQALDSRRRRAIQLAVEQVRADHPRVRWP